ncbi:MAG: FAD-binding oxidoreductase [Bryobacteraceae bacterium]
MKAKLIESHEIAPDVRHFTFEAADLAELGFVPGQFVSVTQWIADKEIVRAYSIASEPDGGNRFALCLNRVADGHLSPWLFDLTAGGEIDIKPPLGTFTLRPTGRDVLLVGTGTGVAPFRSILRAELGKSERKFTLLFGTRYETTILYGEEFGALAQKHSDQMRYWPTLSRGSESWSGRRGYVQNHLDEAIGERRDLDVMVCGLAPMVDQVRALLKGMGFERRQIIVEKYD